MLKVTTEEQKTRIEEILGERIYFSWPLDFISTPAAIYLDGDIPFDKMAEIVDYLRGK